MKSPAPSKRWFDQLIARFRSRNLPRNQSANAERTRELFQQLELFALVPLLIILAFVGVYEFFASVFPDAPAWLVTVLPPQLRGIATVRSETLVLPVVAFLTIYVIVERRTAIERIEQTALSRITDVTKALGQTRADFDVVALRLIQSVQGVDFQSFDSELALKTKLNESVRNAKQVVFDLTWAHSGMTSSARSPETQAQLDLLEAEYEEIVATVGTSKSYREIFVLSRLSRVNKLLLRRKQNPVGYECRLHENTSIPRLQFVAIDRSEVFFVSEVHGVRCSVKHPMLVRLLCQYFEDAWGTATPIASRRDGKVVWDDTKLDEAIKRAREKLDAH